MSYFKISDFKAAFSSGIARPNLWLAELTVVPTDVGPVSTNIGQFSFRCEKAEIPGRSVATVDDTGSGPTLKLPYEVTYNDIELTIICANDMKERKYFDGWIDKIVPNVGDANSGLVSYYSNFARGNTLVLSQLNDSGEKTISYTLHDVYPVGISAMNLSWEEINTYQRFSVTMNYRYHTFKLETTAVT